MDTKLIVSASPHLRSEETTTGLMANVIVALVPCVVASAIIFGLRALLVTAVSVVASVAFEWLYCKLLKKPNPVGDLSAVVTGIILALNVPVGMPIGELIVGDFVAIIVVKQLFGGIGMNFANPALVGTMVVPWVIEPVVLVVIAHQQQAVLVAFPCKIRAVGQQPVVPLLRHRGEIQRGPEDHRHPGVKVLAELSRRLARLIHYFKGVRRPLVIQRALQCLDDAGGIAAIAGVVVGVAGVDFIGSGP